MPPRHPRFSPRIMGEINETDSCSVRKLGKRPRVFRSLLFCGFPRAAIPGPETFGEGLNVRDLDQRRSLPRMILQPGVVQKRTSGLTMTDRRDRLRWAYMIYIQDLSTLLREAQRRLALRLPRLHSQTDLWGLHGTLNCRAATP